MRDPEEKVPDEKYRIVVAVEERLYRFQMKKGIFVHEHMNIYTKLLIDPVNVDAMKRIRR